MSDLYLNGIIYGNIYNSNTFIGSVYKGNFIGKLNNTVLQDGCKIEGTINKQYNNTNQFVLTGLLNCNYKSYNTSNITDCSLKANINGVVRELPKEQFNVIQSIINDINIYIKNFGNISLGSNYGTFIININNKTDIVKLNNSSINTVSYRTQINDKILSLFMSQYYIYITIGDRCWLLPSSENYICYIILNCYVYNDNIINVTEYNNNVVYNRVKTELQNIYNEILPSNINKFIPKIKEPYNNLFNEYYVRHPSINQYLNINIGLENGLIKLVNKNDNNYVSAHVFNNPNLNVLGKSTDYNTVIIDYIDKDSDEAKATALNERIYNYEKYNQYIYKLDLNEIGQEYLINYLNLLRKTYKLDILVDDNNNIIAVYIVNKL